MKNKKMLWLGILLMALGLLLSFPRTAHEQEKIEDKAEIISVDNRAEKIDAYFKKNKMPLGGYGGEFISAADKYGIEWNLLAAISVVESTGGKAMCGHNPFGWGSCRGKIGQFESVSKAIDYVSMNLGGQNPRTRSAYAGGIDADLWSYNGQVEATYPGKVKKIMRDIEATPLPR